MGRPRKHTLDPDDEAELQRLDEWLAEDDKARMLIAASAAYISRINSMSRSVQGGGLKTLDEAQK